MRSEFVRQMVSLAEALSGGAIPPAEPAPGTRWYSASRQREAGMECFAARDAALEVLVASGSPAQTRLFPGERVAVGERSLAISPRDPEACAALRAAFPFTAPAALPQGQPSFGCGDRLGRAAPGHLAALGARGAGLTLAQQSVRELTLTRRTFQDVVDAATWYAFREGYQGGFGADGDHLKSAEEVRQMLAAGATFITLDLSLCLGRAELAGAMPDALRRLAGREWSAGDVRLSASEEDVAGFWRVYGPAFPFIEDASALCRDARGAGAYDLEVSVDETPETTRPVDHLLLAMELQRREVPVTSVAPRFPGEFQKAIDYIGDLSVFERELIRHAAIARAFGHKLGIHSGSDKFTVFPLIGRHAGAHLHAKTAGTSWLEALRVVAAADPALFRACWAQATEGFPRAKQYYHIRTELADVAGADRVDDSRLPELLDQEAPRQFLHITYGEILHAPGAGGGTLGERIHALLATNEDAYAAALEAHFRRHADDLGL